MIDNGSTLPVPADAPVRVSSIAQLADIPEEEIWLSKQKSARTRRAYRLDMQHFMRTLAITTLEELRRADHKAVIAWERYMREIRVLRRRRSAADLRHYRPSTSAWCGTTTPRVTPVGEVERPAINRDITSCMTGGKGTCDRTGAEASMTAGNILCSPFTSPPAPKSILNLASRRPVLPLIV